MKTVSRFEAEIEEFKRDVDQTLLRENLKLTPEQRAEKFMRVLRFVEELQRAGRESRARQAA